MRRVGVRRVGVRGSGGDGIERYIVRAESFTRGRLSADGSAGRLGARKMGLSIALAEREWLPAPKGYQIRYICIEGAWCREFVT